MATKHLAFSLMAGGQPLSEKINTASVAHSGMVLALHLQCIEIMKKTILAIASAAILFSTISSAMAETFPATVAFRKAATGPGYVLVINTTVKQDLPAVLTVTSGALGSVNRRTVNLTWRHPTQLGYLEGVTVYPGDHVELANNYYDTLAVDLPR